ncbi:hypothetical protein IJH66_03130 [Candidatus Saccharibacteria bacterium]|nr:hypothetical protein [Candidatus Saccharibacteria bacterium]
MSSETIAALRGSLSTLLLGRADFSVKTYNEPPRQFVGSDCGKNQLGSERTIPRSPKSGPPYRIRDVTGS